MSRYRGENTLLCLNGNLFFYNFAFKEVRKSNRHVIYLQLNGEQKPMLIVHKITMI